MVGVMLLNALAKFNTCRTYVVFIKLSGIDDVRVCHNKKALANARALWELLGSNQRPPACKAGALNQLS